MNKYNKEQLQMAVNNTVHRISRHAFPVMASRAWDIFRANNPLHVVTEYWKKRPYNGNPPDFNKLLAEHPRVTKVIVDNNTYYLVKPLV